MQGCSDNGYVRHDLASLQFRRSQQWLTFRLSESQTDVH